MRRLYYNDDEFSQAFSELKDYREVPPVGNWREINARLDQRTAFRYTKLIGIAATLAIVVGLGFGIYFSTEPARERTQAIKRENLTKPTVIAPIVQPHVETKTEAVVTNDNRIDEALENIQAGLAVLNASREPDVIKPIRSIRKPSFAAPTKSFNRSAYEILTMVGDDVDNDLRPKVRNVAQQTNAPFYVGVNIQPQHTMLTHQAASYEEQLHQNFSPGLAYGVTAGYRISEAWALETGGLFSMENQRYEAAAEQQLAAKSMAKQNTSAPDEATTVQSRLALNYYRVPLMVKFRMPWTQRRSIRDESVSLIGGVQYGYLRNGFNSYNNIDDEMQTDVVTEDIKRSDVQVLSGIERASSLSKNFSISYGFRVGYGLRQIS
jgi:hypothetical protein